MKPYSPAPLGLGGESRAEPWRRTGLKAWPLALAAIFLFAGLGLCQESQYHFDLSGNLLAQTSETVALPQVLASPQNQIVIPGQPASFSVLVADTSGLSYQWLFNGAAISAGSGDTLLLTNVSAANEGVYAVVLVNGAGSITSAPAALFIDANANGIPDSWELAYFGHPVSGSGDSDGDGVSDLQEYLDGTNPTNALSALYRLSLGGGGTLVVVPNQPAYTNGQTVTLTAISTNDVPFHGWIGDTNSHSNTVSLVMNANKSLFAYFTPITLEWTNTLSGDWNVATNWTPNLPPGSNDIAILNPEVVVTLSNDLVLAGLTMGSPGFYPTLTGPGALTINGTFTWAGGTLSGTGRITIPPGATLNLPSLFTITLTDRTLENQGTMLWNGTGNFNLNNAIITNDAGAIFAMQTPLTLGYGGGVPRFDNAGTFVAYNGIGTTSIGPAFNNYSIAQLQGGTLTLSGGGTNAGTISLSTLNLAGGAFATGFGSVISGDGSLLVNGGNHSLAGTINLPGPPIFNAGSVNITGDYTCTTDVTIAGGIVSFNGTGTIAPPRVIQTSGTLDGARTVTVGNLMNWTGGTMSGTGRTVIPAGATLNVGGPNGVTLTARTLENGGTANWTGSILVNGGVITNRAGALFSAQTAVSMNYEGGLPRFDNAGTFRTTAAGTTSISASLDNYNLVDIQSGTLAVSGGGTNAGTISVPAGTTLNFNGGAFGAGPASLISGGGSLQFNGASATLDGIVNLSGPHLFTNGNINITGNYTCTNHLVIAGATASFNGAGTVAPVTFTLTSGLLDGAQTVTVGSLMNWTGGGMSGAGRTVISPGATLNLNGGVNNLGLTTRTLENGGTAIWAGIAGFVVNNGVITNQPGALFNAQNSATFYYGGGAPRFDNAGTFRKSVSTGITGFNLPFNNYGLVDIQSGFLAMNGGYASASNAVLNSLLAGRAPGTNFGQLQIPNAVTLNGALSVNFANGYLPTTNDSFTLLTAGSRNGVFRSFSYPASLVTMQLSNTPNSVVVLVSRLGPADKVLVPPEISGTNITLCWGALPNVTYRVEVNSSLDPSTWIALPGDVTSSNDIACKADVLTSSNRFYRIRVLP